MDSAQITLSSVTASDQILLEAATGGFVALDATNEFGKDEGDYILSEQTSVGEFTKGETVTGQTSGQTATILAEDTDALKLYITENSLFVSKNLIENLMNNSIESTDLYDLNFREAKDKFEKNYLFQKLKINNFNMTLTAKMLKLDRVSLYRKVKSLKIKID